MEGRLDILAANQLQQEMTKALPGVKKLVFDLEKLAYISSAGLRVFLFTQKYIAGNKGSLVIRKTTPEALEALNMTGFSKILTLE